MIPSVFASAVGRFQRRPRCTVKGLTNRWSQPLAVPTPSFPVECAMRALRVPRITTHASLAARTFFDRHGFQLDREERVECRGTYLRRFVMHKLLSKDQEA